MLKGKNLFCYCWPNHYFFTPYQKQGCFLIVIRWLEEVENVPVNFMIMGKIYVVGLESDSYWNILWQGENWQCVNHKIIKTNTEKKNKLSFSWGLIREEKDTIRNNIEIIQSLTISSNNNQNGRGIGISWPLIIKLKERTNFH